MRSANSVLRNASPSSFRNLTFTRCHAKNHRRARCMFGRTSSAFPHAPARARHDGRENLLEQAPSLATHMARSHRDLAKQYLQVVHSGVLASSDSPLTPCPNKCQACAWHLRRERLQLCLGQKLHWLDVQGCGSLDLGEICQFHASKCFAFQFSQSHVHTLPCEIPQKSKMYSRGDEFGVSSRPRARATRRT